MARLLYLCTHPRNSSPSQRYRFEQFEPYLRQQGFDVEYASALRSEEIPVFYGKRPAREKLHIALNGIGRRVASITPGLAEFDVVLVQRQAFFLFGAWSEWLAHLRAPVVLDFDDAIWIHAVSEGNRRFSFLKNVAKTADIAALATSVIAGNDYLATWARQHNRDVRVIPTCVDTDRYVPPTQREGDGRVTIGWCGSPSTIAHLRPILPVLERVQATYGARVRTRVMGDPNFRHEPLGLVGEAWNSEAELRFLQAMDIGLMPLPDDEWTRGKCGLKGLTSMASGAATVMSPVGVNRQIITDGENGFLASDADSWYRVLCRLVDDAALRARVANAGRATVVEQYSIARWRDTFAQTLLDAAAQGPRYAQALRGWARGRRNA